MEDLQKAKRQCSHLDRPGSHRRHVRQCKSLLQCFWKARLCRTSGSFPWMLRSSHLSVQANNFGVQRVARSCWRPGAGCVICVLSDVTQSVQLDQHGPHLPYLVPVERDEEVAELLGAWCRFSLHWQRSTATHIITHAHRAARTTYRYTHHTPKGRGVGTPRVIRHHGLPPSSEAMGSVGAPAPGNGLFHAQESRGGHPSCDPAPRTSPLFGTGQWLRGATLHFHAAPPRVVLHVPSTTSPRCRGSLRTGCRLTQYVWDRVAALATGVRLSTCAV